MTGSPTPIATAPAAVRGGPLVERLLFASAFALVILSGLVSLPGRESVAGGHLLALLTLVTPPLMLAVFLTRPRLLAGAQWTLLLIAAFPVLALASMAAFGGETEAVQNVACYASFATAVLAATVLPGRWSRQLRTALLLGLAMAAAVMTLALTEYGRSTGGPFYRPYALYALIGLGWLLAELRIRVGRRDWRGALPWLGGALVTLGLVYATQSRTAYVVGIGLLVLSQFRLGRRHRALVAAGWLVAVLALGVGATFYGPMKERFTGGSRQLVLRDDGIKVVLGRHDEVRGPAVSLNLNGRDVFWSTTIRSLSKAPLLGQGPGSSQAVVAAAWGQYVKHPHNDHLRLLHDFGIVGYLLWLAGIVAALRALVRANMQRGGARDEHAVAITAAIMALAALLPMMLLTNPLAYWFVMFPIGFVVGNGLRSAVIVRQAAAASHHDDAS